jgi:hypothetical protein
MNLFLGRQQSNTELHQQISRFFPERMRFLQNIVKAELNKNNYGLFYDSDKMT